MTLGTIVLPFQQIVRWLFAVALVVAGLSFLPALLSDARFDTLMSQSSNGGDPGFNLTLPQRSLALQTTTGTVDDEGNPGPALPPPNPSGLALDDERLGQLVPGAVAALAAVFPAQIYEGLDQEPEPAFFVWQINPRTGDGEGMYTVRGSEVNAALAAAAASERSVLIAPEDGSYPALYALPSNECMLISLFPDGKEARMIFDCAS